MNKFLAMNGSSFATDNGFPLELTGKGTKNYED